MVAKLNLYSKSCTQFEYHYPSDDKIRLNSPSMTTITNDQDRLIGSSETEDRNSQTSKILFKYISWKLAPFIWIFFSSLFISSPGFIYFVSFILIIIDIWLCRRLYSYPLIGLSWSLEIPDLHTSFEDLITFNIEPDPFVPSPTNSNIFWLLICGRVAIFLLISLFTLFKFQIIAFFVLLMTDAVEIFNLYSYLKCLSLSKKQSEDTFRSVMINAVHSDFLDAIPVIENDENASNPTEPLQISEQKNEQKSLEAKSDDKTGQILNYIQEADRNEETHESEDV